MKPKRTPVTGSGLSGVQGMGQPTGNNPGTGCKSPSTPPRPPAQVAKVFDAKVHKLAHRHSLWKVFSDFCELAALTLANAIPQDPEMEKRWHAVRKPYSAEEMSEHAQLLALVTEGLERGGCDFLGEAFMRLEISSKHHGQFFTPYALSRTMAKMLVDGGAHELVAHKGFITVQEPACGAGGMLLAMAEALHERGINPQECMHATAVDLDPTAAYMCLIQLSLSGIPAVVTVGNTLTMEMSRSFRTPMHYLGLWDGKLRRGFKLGTPAAEVTESQQAGGG